jgi:hypothetical protein
MNRPYGDEFGPPEKIAKSTTLEDVLEDPQFRGKVIEYVEDFGLNWSHSITVKGRAEATRNGSGQAHSTVKIPVRNEGGRSARLLILYGVPIVNI